MPIQILDSRVISRIAAGEVIDRPASVVKELVENSLDAGSTQISVEIEGGGLDLIRVSDNGRGIASAELPLAFERHATSKITRFEDMFALTTLGFRGEALPSIAAVAEVEIISCPKNSHSGGFLKIEDGNQLNSRSSGRSQGTTVTVRGLFQSVPARLKFVKSRATESGHIAAVVSQYAMAYPEVKLSLTVDGKNSLNTPGNGTLSDTITQVYGLDVGRNMLELQTPEIEDGCTVMVSGMISDPSVTRSTSNYLSFFVNRSWITNRRLSWAVEEAYRGLLMAGKHPICVINIGISPAEIDVNIHPTKSEVKFRDEAAVFSAVQKAVRCTLIQSAPISRVSEIAEAPYGPRQVTSFLSSKAAEKTEHLHSPNRELPTGVSEALATPKQTLPTLRLLGQIRNSYIVAEGPDGLYIIDQHAAHERILFEKLNMEKTLNKLEVQALLTPEPFDVTPSQASVLNLRLDELAYLGFLIEGFGGNTFVARTIPAVLSGKDWKSMLRELLETETRNRSDFMDRMTALAACHSAVRFGQTLGEDEMISLIRQLEQSDLPNACPHGRPTLICLTYDQLLKEFKRG